MFSELSIELAELTLPTLFDCLFNMYQDPVQIFKVYPVARSDFESDMLLTIYNTTDHTHIKELRPQFNLSASQC